jgi:hypothetical protein
LRLSIRAKARPSKKAKLNKPADDSAPTDPEKNPEQFEPNTEAILDDPPPQDHETFVEQMEIDPMGHADKPPSPTKVADDKTDDVVVTGVSYTAPGNPIALSKHSAKEEFSAVDKGKWKADLETYAHLSTQDIHSGFLNRLYTSRDYEAGLLNMMKERYEVNDVNSA